MKTIAVVEDNADNMLLVKAILGSEYNILDYDNGPAALAELPGSGVELILLDISLPGMDGVEVLHHIRQDETLKDIVAIALTAHAMSGDREKYLNEGFNQYYTKPIIDINDFKAVIASYLT